MDDILSSVKRRFALVYLEDTVVFLRSPRDEINYVEQISSLLRDAGVILKLKNCSFFTGTIDYRGHVVRP